MKCSFSLISLHMPLGFACCNVMQWHSYISMAYLSVSNTFLCPRPAAYRTSASLCCVGRREYCYGLQQCPQSNPSVCLSLAGTAEPQQSQTRPHQTQLHVAPFCLNSKSLHPESCGPALSGPHAVLWCILCVCSLEVHFYVPSLQVRRDAAVGLYAGVGLHSSTVVIVAACYMLLDLELLEIKDVYEVYVCNEFNVKHSVLMPV